MKKGKNSINKRRLEKFMHSKIGIVGFVLMVAIIVVCLAAPLLTQADPSRINVKQKYLPPSAEHPFGCDQNGRDLFARLLYGGRISILIGLASALLTNLLGTALGCIAGFRGGWVDQVIIYITETVACIPSQMLILILMGLAGQGVTIMMAVFIFTGWGTAMRMTRSRILSLKNEAFVERCKATGIGSMSIMFRHLLPNTLGVFIINLTSDVAGYVLAEAGLSFLGLGVPKGIPTWGNMLNAARDLITMQNHPLLWILPGLAISLFSLGVNFFGDGLRDAFDVSQE